MGGQREDRDRPETGPRGTGELDGDKARVPESRVLQAVANNVTAMPV